MATTTTTVSLKLLIDPVSHKVLFAEAGKDFVDFLFNIMALPVGTIIRLLSKQEMVGCLGNLYESIEKLSDTYILSTANKEALMKPMVANNSSNYVPLLMPNTESSTSNTDLYRCGYNYGSNCRTYVSEYPNSTCPRCNNVMNQKATFVNPPAMAQSSSSEGGYVKGVVTYMVMDDLVVSPMSTISSITLLSKFNITNVGVLQEKVIDMGMDEGVKLLSASMQSNAVLTAVFLGKKSRK